MDRSPQPSTSAVPDEPYTEPQNVEEGTTSDATVVISTVQSTTNHKRPAVKLQNEKNCQPAKRRKRLEANTVKAVASDGSSIVSATRTGNNSDNQMDKKMTSANNVSGGGGADAAHGQAFHLTLAMLLICRLVSMQQADPGIQYDIWLEKPGYGKFDDIVVRYKKSGEDWVQICVQCKHGEEKVLDGGKKSIKNINADDLLSGKNKHFALMEYLKCFSEVKYEIEDCQTFYVLLTNRSYDPKHDNKYVLLQREISNDNCKTLLRGDGFSVQYNSDLHNHLLDQTKLDKKYMVKLKEETTEEFCKKFLCICDDRNLEVELKTQLSKHCKGNKVSTQILQARLYYLVSQMYQHKREPKQNDFIDVFNGKNTHYKIQPPHPRFTGRTKEIMEIERALNSKKGNYILDLLVTGMAGMGKTQVVLKYIDDNKQNFKHVIWINAESFRDLEKSFVDLAVECQLITGDFKNDMSHIMKAIYSYFSKDTLFVFDNASKDLLSKNDNNEKIYLPNYRQGKDNTFIVISQDQAWTTNQSNVTVDKFSEKEALQYLDETIDCKREEKLKIAASVQFWPLALCLAVSYIKLGAKRAFSASDVSAVIQLFQIDDEDLHKHFPLKHEDEPYNKSLRKLWELLQTKLQSNKLAIQILHILSFSYPDNFPVDLIKFKCYNEKEVTDAILLLVDLSLLMSDKREVSIHRALQSVIRTSVISDNNLHNKILLQGRDTFNRYIKTLNEYESIKSLGNIHLCNFLQNISNSQIEVEKYVDIAYKILRKITKSRDFLIYGKNVTIFDKIISNIKKKLGSNCLEHTIIEIAKASALDSMGKYDEALSISNHVIKVLTEKLGKDHPYTVTSMNSKASVLDSMGKYDDALGIYNYVIEVRTEQLGKDHLDTVSSMHNKALVLDNMGKYDDALNIYNHVIEVRTEKLGKDHFSTVTSMHKKASVLVSMGKFDEALSISNYVIEVNTEKLGKDHPDTLTSMHNKASIKNSMGKYDDALNIYNNVIKVKTEKLGKDHPGTVTSMHNKASVLDSMGKYDDALSIYNQVIEVQTDKLGKDHPDTLTSMNNKASVLNSMGKYDVALSIYNHVIEVQTDKLGKDYPDTVTSMHNKASVLVIMGKYDEALNIYNHVIDVKTEKLGKDHPSTVTSMHNKACVLDKMGKYDEALSTFNHVIEVRTEKLGKDHPSTVNSMHYKALVLNKIGKYDEALRIYNHVIEVRTEKLGKDHPDTVTSMHCKAFVLNEMGKYDEALSIYNHVIEVRTEKLGKDHPSTVTSMHNKALVLDNMGKYDEALSIYNHVIEVTTEKLGKDHPDTVSSMHNKACVLDKMGKYDEALSTFNHVIEVRTEKLGKDHPSTVNSMHNKASVLNKIGKYDEALRIYNHVIEVRTEKLGKDHPDTVTSMHCKAFVLNEMGKYDEVLSMYNHVIEVRTEKLGKDHPSTVTSMHNKASVLDNMGKYDEALSIYNHVIEVRTEKLGKDHPDTVTSMHNKALVLKSMGKYDAALSIYNHVIEVETEKLGKGHPDTVTSMHNKALVLHNMGKYNEALSIYNHVIEVRTEKLGKDHPHTQSSIRGKAAVLRKMQNS